MVYKIHKAYPPPPKDVKTAERLIPSRRWEYVRMGIEDYMLLGMARDKIKALGDAGDAYAYRQELENIIKVVMENRTNDRELFRTERRKLLELVEKLSQ